jgi:hypothetical protein
MAIQDYTALLTAIDIIIATNGVGDITAAVHNPLLKDITDTLKSLSGNYVTLVEDSPNVYSGAPDSGISAYVEGTIFNMKFPTSITGATNINLSGVGNRLLKKESGGVLVNVTTGDISATVSYTVIITSSNIQLIGKADPLSDAQVETAYNNQVAAASEAEMIAGTITAIRRMTPERIKQGVLPRKLEIRTQALPYTVLDADTGKHIELTGTGTLTIPTGLTTTGQWSIAITAGTAQTLTTSGVTVNTANDDIAQISAGGIISIAATATNTVRLAGNTEA